ncbi:hypothetical protein GUJ93_ZPchr0008g12396 [Zizania palustris]|uniref:Uncharacterized protein n=1 Tax=Zizania palustris TaxID=103762 RepID=A0A8J5RFL0_ZIZPA|nr:hypothetical protein GUJ93_ZPchr0008g12396 [Zizania palustris]
MLAWNLLLPELDPVGVGLRTRPLGSAPLSAVRGHAERICCSHEAYFFRPRRRLQLYARHGCGDRLVSPSIYLVDLFPPKRYLVSDLARCKGDLCNKLSLLGFIRWRA